MLQVSGFMGQVSDCATAGLFVRNAAGHVLFHFGKAGYHGGSTRSISKKETTDRDRGFRRFTQIEIWGGIEENQRQTHGFRGLRRLLRTPKKYSSTKNTKDTKLKKQSRSLVFEEPSCALRPSWIIFLQSLSKSSRGGRSSGEKAFHGGE